MSEVTKVAPNAPQVDLVLANTASRLNCTIPEARKFLERRAALSKAAQPAPPSQPPTSKSDAVEAML